MSRVCWRSSRKASHSRAVIIRCWCDSFIERPVHFCGPPVAQQTISMTRYLKPAGLGSARAIREAAARENVAMVAMLIEHGARAASTGAGRWVLHPELAPMLACAGAGVDRSGSWIGLSCTGNQGRKDDPQYVAALLRHGARVNDKRLTGQGTDGGRATALHYAAKARFMKTIKVLLDHGADPTALDDNGFIPLDWLERAAPSVDRQAVRRLLRLPRLS